MSDSKNSVLICGGEFKIVKITEAYFGETIELFKDHHLKYENISVICKLADSNESVHEMETLLRAVLSDGVSFAAIHCQTEKLIAFAANKILCPNEEACSLDGVYSTFRTHNMFCVGQYIERLEGEFNIFKEWNINCALEIFILTTHKDFGKRNLATLLSKHSIDYARQMLHGTLKDQEALPSYVRNLRPQAVCSSFSSKFSQKVGERLGFETLNKIPHSEFSFDGKTFAEQLDPVHSHAVFAAIRL